MKTIVALALCTLLFGAAFGQEFGLSGGYQQVLSPEWNKAIQTYNTSRVFLNTPQPLIGPGYVVGFHFLSAGNEKFAAGFLVNVARHSSYAENPNLNVEVAALLLDASAKLRFRLSNGGEHGFQLDLNPGVSLATIGRYVNDEAATIETEEDETNVRSWGVGPVLEVQLGYAIPLGDKWQLVPFAGVAGAYLWDERADVVLTQVHRDDIAESTSMLRAQAGLRITVH